LGKNRNRHERKKNQTILRNRKKERKKDGRETKKNMRMSHYRGGNSGHVCLQVKRTQGVRSRGDRGSLRKTGLCHEMESGTRRGVGKGPKGLSRRTMIGKRCQTEKEAKFGEECKAEVSEKEHHRKPSYLEGPAPGGKKQRKIADPTRGVRRGVSK